MSVIKALYEIMHLSSLLSSTGIVKKHSTVSVSQSSIEAKYHDLTHTTSKVVWHHWFSAYMGVFINLPTPYIVTIKVLSTSLSFLTAQSILRLTAILCAVSSLRHYHSMLYFLNSSNHWFRHKVSHPMVSSAVTQSLHGSLLVSWAVRATREHKFIVLLKVYQITFYLS